jgi:glycosyltransferase involved in cell wall biosynthesis
VSSKSPGASEAPATETAGRRIRVAVMMLTLASGRMGGTEVYAENLVENLRQLDDDRFQFIIVRARQRAAGRSTPRSAPRSAPHVESRGSATISNETAFQTVTLDFITAGVTHAQKLWAWIASTVLRRRIWREIESAAGGEIDIAFYPFTAVQPRPRRGTKSIVVVHDLQHLDMPHAFTWAQRIYRRIAYERPSMTCDAVVTVSDFTSASVIEHLGVPSTRIHRVYPGIDTDLFRPGTRTAPVEPVLYYPARGLPHKNHQRLFRAVERARELHPGLTLILSGSDEQSLHPLPDFVVHVGNITPENVRDLYRGVTAVVFPSLYEGFGFPPLEALATGTPVVASRAGALPEVLAEHAILVDQLDVTSITDGIERALTKSHSSSHSSPDSANAVAHFTWSKTAENVVDVFSEVHNHALLRRARAIKNRIG